MKVISYVFFQTSSYFIPCDLVVQLIEPKSCLFFNGRINIGCHPQMQQTLFCFSSQRQIRDYHQNKDAIITSRQTSMSHVSIYRPSKHLPMANIEIVRKRIAQEEICTTKAKQFFSQDEIRKAEAHNYCLHRCRISRRANYPSSNPANHYSMHVTHRHAMLPVKRCRMDYRCSGN